MDRRKFLKTSMHGIGSAYLLTSPLGIMLGNIASSLFQRASAIELGVDPGLLEKKFFSMSLLGGPSRWFWDLPLIPNGNDVFQYGKLNDPKTSMLITKLKSDSNGVAGVIGEYATTKIGDFHLPYLWAGKIPTVNGGSENMSALAQNMLFMRGIKSVDGHSLGRVLQVKPNSGTSLGGLIADRSTTPIPALYMGNTRGTFSSAKGIGQQNMALSDPFSAAFAPFNGAQSLVSNTSNSVEAINRVLDLMKAKAGDRHKALPFTYQDRINARRLMLNQYTNLKQQYDTLLAKYEDLISRSLGDPTLRLAGADDLPLQGSANNLFKFHYSSTLNHYTGTNLADFTTRGSSIGRLASMMAVAEFMFCGGSFNQSFSSTLHAEVSDLSGSILDSAIVDGVNKTALKTNLYSDAHFSGSYIQLYQFTRYYRAISACLFELVQQLKQKSSGTGNLFDQTVIAIHSEFNRIPKDEGSVSDHGPGGSCYSVLSGMITEPLVVGDIKKEGGKANACGTWGLGATMPEFTNQQAVIGNAVSTVSLMLNVPTPTPNNPSFVLINSKTGKIASAVSRTKNVA